MQVNPGARRSRAESGGSRSVDHISSAPVTPNIGFMQAPALMQRQHSSAARIPPSPQLSAARAAAESAAKKHRTRVGSTITTGSAASGVMTNLDLGDSVSSTQDSEHLSPQVNIARYSTYILF